MSGRDAVCSCMCSEEGEPTTALLSYQQTEWLPAYPQPLLTAAMPVPAACRTHVVGPQVQSLRRPALSTLAVLHTGCCPSCAAMDECMQEGWAPSTFTSSRAAPAQRKQQNVEDFLDEDELEERQKRGMTLTVRAQGEACSAVYCMLCACVLRCAGSMHAVCYVAVAVGC